MKCTKCKVKTCIITDKPCKEIEQELRSKGIYSSDYIRPEVSKNTQADGKGRFREVSVSDIEKVAIKRAYRLKYGVK